MSTVKLAEAIILQAIGDLYDTSHPPPRRAAGADLTTTIIITNVTTITTTETIITMGVPKINPTIGPM